MGYEQMRYEEILVQLHDLGNARRERLLAAEQGLPPILWVVLILGGVITVGFTYLFGLNNTLVHLLMVAALALIISISLFTVAALDYPFKGDIHIHPSAYEQDLERFRESKLRTSEGEEFGVLNSLALTGTVLSGAIGDTSSKGCVCRFRVYSPKCVEGEFSEVPLQDLA
jgi:hypothetical protein